MLFGHCQHPSEAITGVAPSHSIGEYLLLFAPSGCRKHEELVRLDRLEYFCPQYLHWQLSDMSFSPGKAHEMPHKR